MPKTKTELRVFIASPGDVKEDRQVAREIILELDLIWSDLLGVTLRPIMWETHAFPGISTDSQAVINEQIKDDYDIFVAIFWSRLGTPTGRAGSGTEEELERAIAKWKSDPSAIRVMVYFRTSPIPPGQSDPAQLQQLSALQERLKEKGIFYWSYPSVGEFSSLLRLHLSREMGEWGKSWGMILGDPNVRHNNSGAC